jgi:fluoroquinolone transport system ATP-binding protein
VEYLDGGEMKEHEFSMEGQGKAELQQFIGAHDVKTIHSLEPSLEDIFIKLTGRGLE